MGPSVVCHYVDIFFHLNRLIGSFWGRVTVVLNDFEEGVCTWRKSYRVDYNRLPLKASPILLGEEEVKGWCSFPIIGNWVNLWYSGKGIISHDSLSWSLVSRSMFSRSQLGGKPSEIETKPQTNQKPYFHGQIHLGNFSLSKYKQISLSHPRRDRVGFFSKFICVLEVYLITIISFHCFEKHTLTRLSLIFKILR